MLYRIPTDRAAHIIRQHYGLTRPVTAEEIAAEYAMLERRGITDLDDSQHRLAASLDVFRVDR